MCFYTSWSLRHPNRDVLLIIWTDYTRYSEPLMLEMYPQSILPDAARVPEDSCYRDTDTSGSQ